MKIMQKKLSKSLLVSVLALILVSSAAAAFIWISNIRTTVVTVRPIPVTLTGDFKDSPMIEEETIEMFNFTVEDPSYAVGYVFIQFVAPGHTLNVGDITISSLALAYYDGSMAGDLMPGYPTNTPTDQLTFVFGRYDQNAFDFTWGGGYTNGTIVFRVTYNVLYVIEASIRLTSTAS